MTALARSTRPPLLRYVPRANTTISSRTLVDVPLKSDFWPKVPKSRPDTYFLFFFLKELEISDTTSTKPFFYVEKSWRNRKKTEKKSGKNLRVDNFSLIYRAIWLERILVHFCSRPIRELDKFLQSCQLDVAFAETAITFFWPNGFCWKFNSSSVYNWANFVPIFVQIH